MGQFGNGHITSITHFQVAALGLGVVGVGGGGQVKLIWLFGFEERPYGSLVGEIQFGVSSADDSIFRVTIRNEVSNDRRTNHAAVAGDINFRGLR